VASVWVCERQHRGQTVWLRERQHRGETVWVRGREHMGQNVWVCERQHRGQIVWVHERQHTGKTVCRVMAAFLERFDNAQPRRATLLDWEKLAFALGSVKDRPRSGSKSTRLETCAEVSASIERSPSK
jgi:hypothetical protein